MKSAEPNRAYRMTARATAAASTGERILDAAEARFWAGGLEQVTLAGVAADAEVTVQTVIRRFGSKQGVMDAAIARAHNRVSDQRLAAPVGDVPGAIANLMEHYETWGDRTLRLLSEEGGSATIRQITNGGRAFHRDWVQQTFAPQIAGAAEADREPRAAQIHAITDVQVWKLLRRDSGLSRAATERSLIHMIDGLEGR
jgi:AcrR family transcriptional regulator